MKQSFFVVLLICFLTSFSFTAEVKILTNHLGYEPAGPKHAVILGKAGDRITGCSLKNYGNDQQVTDVAAKASGPVQKWKDWFFWTLNFDSYDKEGKYYLECVTGSGPVRSFPFVIQRDLLERNTMSDAIYYFKGQRSSGEFDKADRHLKFDGAKPGIVDAHGGWWDATGDYGKHFSHLSFSTYFNPQQIPFTVYSLLKSYEQTKLRGKSNFAVSNSLAG
jgi:Cellulase N-terminal ig-like domain